MVHLANINIMTAKQAGTVQKRLHGKYARHAFPESSHHECVRQRENAGARLPAHQVLVARPCPVVKTLSLIVSLNS